MCKCTPNIRTPYCGKLGCEWPGSKPEGARSEELPPDVKLTDWLRQLAATTVFNRETFANARLAMRLAANRLELYEAGLAPKQDQPTSG